MKIVLRSLCLLVAFLPLPTVAELPSKGLVLQTQILLSLNGSDTGPIDGELGGNTKDAILRYIKQHNLSLTGEGTTTQQLTKLTEKLREEFLTVSKTPEKQGTNKEAAENEQPQEGEEKLTGSDLAIEAAKDAVNYMANFYTIAGSIVAVILAAAGAYGVKTHRDLKKQTEKTFSDLATKIQDAEKVHRNLLLDSSRKIWALHCRDTINLYDAMNLATDKGAKATSTIQKNMARLLSNVHDIAAKGTSAAIQPEDNHWIALFLLYRANALKRSGSFMPALRLAEEASKLPGIPDTMLATACFCAGCYASQSDNTDLCFTHLAMALSKSPDFLPDIETDNDLDKIRSDPRYAALVGR